MKGLAFLLLLFGLALASDNSLSYLYYYPLLICIAGYLLCYYFKKARMILPVLNVLLFLTIIMVIFYVPNRLYYHVWLGRVEEARKMIVNGADINKDYYGKSIVYAAFLYGSCDSHAHYRHDNQLSSKQRYVVTTPMVRMLVENGLGQDHINFAMYYSLIYNYTDLSSYLVDHIDVNRLVDFGVTKDRWHEEGDTESVLYVAVRKGRVELVKKMLELKPEWNIQDSQHLCLIDYMNDSEKEEMKDMLGEYIGGGE